MAVYSYENGEFKEVSTGGGHQITQDETVAKPNLYGLDAIENNPDVEGTLANDIKGLKEKDTTTDAEILGINEKLETVETLKETVGTIEVSVREITTLKETIEAQKKTIETLNTTITTQAATIREHTATLKTLSGLIDNTNTYRGKSLGSEVTAQQVEEIRYGRFTDMYIGDYWTIDGIDYLIAGMNYWLEAGNERSTTNHLVLIQKTPKYEYAYNYSTGNSTATGYLGSELYTAGLEQAKTTIKAAFPNLLYTHSEHLTNKVENGIPTDGTNTVIDVDIPTEVMVFGHNNAAAKNDGAGKIFASSESRTQLPLFRLRPKFINVGSKGFWLRDVVGDKYASCVDALGTLTYSQTITKWGVRPVFGICYNS